MCNNTCEWYLVKIPGRPRLFKRSKYFKNFENRRCGGGGGGKTSPKRRFLISTERFIYDNPTTLHASTKWQSLIRSLPCKMSQNSQYRVFSVLGFREFFELRCWCPKLVCFRSYTGDKSVNIGAHCGLLLHDVTSTIPKAYVHDVFRSAYVEKSVSMVDWPDDFHAHSRSNLRMLLAILHAHCRTSIRVTKIFRKDAKICFRFLKIWFLKILGAFAYVYSIWLCFAVAAVSFATVLRFWFDISKLFKRAVIFLR